jgi:hypothetical protein
MATISTLVNAAGLGLQPAVTLRPRPYMVENIINFASATTAKGSALAAADVIQALQIPAQTFVLAAGYEVLSAITGDVTMSVGVTGVLATAFVNAATLQAATSVGTYGTSSTTGYPIVSGAASTVDLLISASTTALSAGSVRVFALLCDAQDRVGPTSVDREQLA